MTAAGPTRSFGPAPEGTIVTEPLAPGGDLPRKLL